VGSAPPPPARPPWLRCAGRVGGWPSALNKLMRSGSIWPQARLPAAPPCRCPPRVRSACQGEAARLLAVLRELLATNRCELTPRADPQKGGRTPVGNDAPGNSLRRGTAPDDRTAETSSFGDGRPGRGRNTPQGMSAGTTVPERTLGWECPDGSIYLLPELARREVGSTASAAGRCTSSCPSWD
jgi:hypothetical protein